jgi:hypothetical protein
MSVVRWLLAWLAAVAVVTLLGSVVQTQFNLARITGLEVAVPWSLRIETTWFDLVHFAPIWAAIMALAMIIAMPVAGLLARRWQAFRTMLYPLAGFVSVIAALLVMDAMLPVTPVGAARTWLGLISMAVPGALAGWTYHGLLSSR